MEIQRSLYKNESARHFIVVAGDFNDYDGEISKSKPFSRALSTIKGLGLVNSLIDGHVGGSRTHYQRGLIDHLLVDEKASISNERIHKKSVWRGNEITSDHAPSSEVIGFGN